jgi:6-phosphogluconolactonase
VQTRAIADTTVVVLPTESDVAREAAQRTVDTVRAAIDVRGVAHVALAGGSSAVALYRELVQPAWHTAVPWDLVHFWWGDERFVPTDHPESNAGLAYRLLFAVPAHSGESGAGAEPDDALAGTVPGLLIDALKVHRIDTEGAIGAGGGASWAAERYAAELAQMLPRGTDGVPAFDLMLNGVGPDGHTMSVFPNSPALDENAPLVMAIPAPDHVEPHLDRVTLSPRLMGAAQRVLVMCTGDAKADVIARIFGKKRDPRRWPAQVQILPNAVWLLDEMAAAKLPAD